MATLNNNVSFLGAPNVKLSNVGGYGIMLINKTGVASVKGEIVKASLTTSNGFYLNTANFGIPIGVVGEAGVADGSYCLVITSGVAEVLLTDSTASTAGNIICANLTRATALAASMNTVGQIQQIGVALETLSGGTNVLCKCMLNISCEQNVRSAGVVGNGTSDDYAALNTLLAAIGSTPGTLKFPRGIYKLSTSIIIPSNIVLEFENGAMLSPDSAKIVTINGEIKAGLHQIFVGLGTIAGTIKNSEVYPEWWGAIGDDTTDDTVTLQTAINYAGTKKKKLILRPVVYKTTSTLYIGNTDHTTDSLLWAGLNISGTEVKNGTSEGGTIIKSYEAETLGIPIVELTTPDVHSIVLEKMRLTYDTARDKTKTSAVALAFDCGSSTSNGIYFCTFRELQLMNCYKGIGITQTSGKLPIWGCRFEKIHVKVFSRKGIDLNAVTAQGVPENSFRDIYLSYGGVAGTIGTDDVRALDLYGEATVENLGIEQCYGRAINCGTAMVSFKNVHIEYHKCTYTNQRIIYFADGMHSIDGVTLSLEARGVAGNEFKCICTGDKNMASVKINNVNAFITPQTGTSQTGSDTTVVLATSDTAGDDFYNGCIISINGIRRTVTDYNGTTKIATIASAGVSTNIKAYSIYDNLQHGRAYVFCCESPTHITGVYGRETPEVAYVAPAVLEAWANNILSWESEPYQRAAIPTTGTHELGRTYRKNNPTASGYIGWICNLGGTFGTLSGVTGGITSGENILIVSSGTDLYRGCYITITGVTGIKKVASVSGTTVTLTTNADATVVGATVQFSAPTFLGYGAIAAS